MDASLKRLLRLSILLRRVPHLPESNFNVVGRAQGDVRPELHVAIAPISVDALVLLQHSDDCVAYFCECELLADADTRSAVEGEILCTSVSVSWLSPSQKDGYRMHSRRQYEHSRSLIVRQNQDLAHFTSLSNGITGKLRIGSTA